jgi:hypothetical protein
MSLLAGCAFGLAGGATKTGSGLRTIGFFGLSTLTGVIENGGGVGLGGVGFGGVDFGTVTTGLGVGVVVGFAGVLTTGAITSGVATGGAGAGLLCANNHGYSV